MSQIVMLPVGKLHPNAYNPNVMTAEESAELAAEVRHLGRLPKPVVVRPNGIDYVIVDGEHGWRAAQEAGLQEVPCEIIEADDFEAMRQTYKRNQHGTHDPVLLGKMFVEMMASRELSQRKLASDIAVSEGTIRNAVIYAEAARVRNSYAPDTAAKDVSRLTVRQVQKYRSLPDVIRDKWLDAGASMTTFDAFKIKGERESVSTDWAYIRINQAGLSRHIDTYTDSSFRQSVKNLYEMADWVGTLSFALPNASEYAQSVASVLRSVKWLDKLPCKSFDSSDSNFLQPHFTPAEWKDIIADCYARADSPDEMETLVSAKTQVIFNEKGIKEFDQSDPRVELIAQKLREAPDFIRDSPLDRFEQYELYAATSNDPRITEEMLLEAKRGAVETIVQRNRYLTDKRFKDHIGVSERQQLLFCTPMVALERHLQEMLVNFETKASNDLWADKERVLDAAVEAQCKYYDVRVGIIEGRPARDVLRERLSALPEPEFLFLASFLMEEKFGGSGRWFRALNGKDPKVEESRKEEAERIAKEQRLEELESIVREGLAQAKEA